jgi:hypothetical protein
LGFTPDEGRILNMPWDLALPLLVCLATVILFGGIYYTAKKLITDQRTIEERN